MPFTIDQIRTALAGHSPQFLERLPSYSEAAVALVLAGAGDDLSLCAIRRAEHPLDPWSGHMALPGGRSSPEDPSRRAVAERETFEEVGLVLGDPHWIGPLSEVWCAWGTAAGR
jgi:8-oxo-dGTP pyrophosphatase MutT (NUDIX family)